MSTAAVMPIPNPAFAPVDRPPDDEDRVSVGELSSVADVFGGFCVGPVIVWLDVVREACASTAESVDCHMIGTPSPNTHQSEACVLMLRLLELNGPS